MEMVVRRIKQNYESAANIYGAMPEGLRWQVSLVSSAFPRGEGAPKGRIGHWRYEREWEQLTSPYFTHPLLIGLQGRFLASLEMTIRESDVS